jgi:DNA-directed RNA polymerase specialized sigma subunit
MKKITIITALLIVALTCSLSSTLVHASPDKFDHKHGHHHKLIEHEKAEQLKKQGYSKQDIFMAAILSKKTDKNIDEVLDSYKKTKSWEKTAQQLGMDMEEFKRIDAMRKWESFVKNNEKEVKEYLAEYANKTNKEIDKYIEDGFPLRFLIGAAALAKLSEKPLEEIIAYKKEKKSFHDVMETLDINKEQLQQELQHFKEDVKKTLNQESRDS